MIISLHIACHGDWCKLADQSGLDYSDVEAFLDYAACFLSNVGNYRATLSGPKCESWFTNTAQGIWRPEIIPKLAPEKLYCLTANIPKASYLYSRLAIDISAIPPFSLGFPSDTAQSMYYPGRCKITPQEIKTISHAMEQRGIFPENTRIEKIENDGCFSYHVLQASAQTTAPRELESRVPSENICQDRGSFYGIV
jgi:dipeptidyl-peptidase-3